MALLNSLPGAIALGLIWGIMAIGVYITYKVLDIADLTVDGSMATGAAVCAVLIVAGVNPWLSLLAACCAGAACGLLTGIFHTVMGIPAILAGILTQLMLYSINLKIQGKANIPISGRTYTVILSSLDIGKAIGILIGIAAVTIVLLYWFFGTERGTSIRATGDNLKMSRAQGINTNLNKVLGLMISNAIVAVSGALLSQYIGFADINTSRGAIVIGLAAVIIGEAIFSRIAHNFFVKLISILIGGIIYYIVYQVVVFLGLDTDLLKMLSALVVAIFLAVPYWRRRLAEKGIQIKKLSGLFKKKAPANEVVAVTEGNDASVESTDAVEDTVVTEIVEGNQPDVQNAEENENA